MNIGYIPNTPDYTHPADRRRFYFYLCHNKLEYETASPDKYYDVVYVSTRSDIETWSEYKQQHVKGSRSPKIIFDLSDAYLSSDKYDIKSALRGLYCFASGRISKLRLSYKRLLIEMMHSADAIICGSPEQKKLLGIYHDNVHIINDYFGDDIHDKKSVYASKNREINIVWEGLSHGNRPIFEMLKEVLDTNSAFRTNLHLITDQEYCEYGGKYLCQPTSSLLKKIFAKTDVDVFFYSWHPATFSSIATKCDIALLPIPDDPVMQLKPENKLILLWSMGIPVLTTATKAYKRVMQDVGVDWACDSIQDFKHNFVKLAGSQKMRKIYMEKVSHFIQKNYSKERILSRWDNLFKSIQ